MEREISVDFPNLVAPLHSCKATGEHMTTFARVTPLIRELCAVSTKNCKLVIDHTLVWLSLRNLQIESLNRKILTRLTKIRPSTTQVDYRLGRAVSYTHLTLPTILLV